MCVTIAESIVTSSSSLHNQLWSSPEYKQTKWGTTSMCENHHFDHHLWAQRHNVYMWKSSFWSSFMGSETQRLCVKIVLIIIYGLRDTTSMCENHRFERHLWPHSEAQRLCVKIIVLIVIYGLRGTRSMCENHCFDRHLWAQHTI